MADSVLEKYLHRARVSCTTTAERVIVRTSSAICRCFLIVQCRLSPFPLRTFSRLWRFLDFCEPAKFYMSPPSQAQYFEIDFDLTMPARSNIYFFERNRALGMCICLNLQKFVLEHNFPCTRTTTTHGSAGRLADDDRQRGSGLSFKPTDFCMTVDDLPNGRDLCNEPIVLIVKGYDSLRV